VSISSAVEPSAAPFSDTCPGRRQNTALVLILLAGVLVRLLLWYAFRDEPIHIEDERDYDLLARNLLNHGEFTFRPGETPTSLRPPLYPALVAVVYRLSGVENFAAVRLLQACLSMLTVVVAYRLGREIASDRTALWLAGLCCFYPSLIAYGNLLLTETLFTLLLTSACYAIVLTLKRSSIGWAAAAGLALGLAALTRSVVWLAPPLLAVYLLLAGRGGLVRRFAVAAAVVAAFAGTIAPWAIRNTRLQGTFIAIDTMGGRNFMMGNYRYTPLYRSWDAIAIEGDRSWIHEVCAVCPPEQLTSQGKVDKAALRQGLQFVRENPGLTLERATAKFFDFWGLERELIAGTGRGLYGDTSKALLLGLAAVVIGAYAAAMVLAAFGLVFAPPADRRIHWFIVCVIAFVCGMHTVVFGHSRYHLPLMPLVLVYTAGAITQFGAIWAQRKSYRFALASGLCAILFAGWTWLFVAVDCDRLAGVFGHVTNN
jgi:4-amino-4-deoxy-L-arabinose transferase-like glycosyltransferase